MHPAACRPAAEEPHPQGNFQMPTTYLNEAKRLLTRYSYASACHGVSLSPRLRCKRCVRCKLTKALATVTLRGRTTPRWTMLNQTD